MRKLGVAFGAASLAIVASGCGRRFPTPFTSDEMASAGTGDALVHYLHQPGATAAVCAPNGEGPHFHGVRPEDFAWLADGLVDGDVPPVLWQRCVMLMLEGSRPESATALLDAMAHAYRKLLSRSAVETDPEAKARLDAIHQTFLLRAAGTTPSEAGVADDLERLRGALAKRRLGAIATRYGEEVLATVDLDRGLWKGGKLDVAILDDLAAQKNEALLHRIALRVPDPALQLEARRRIVRLHIAASPSKHVKAHAAEIEATVLATGRNAIDLGKNMATSAWLDAERAKVRGVLVRQDVWKQTAKLLAFDGPHPGSSVIPSLGLRGALFARAEGLDDPVTLCAPPDTLDVAPCLLPSELKPKVPIVFVDAEGLLHFVEHVATRDAMRLGYNTANLPLPFDVHGKTLLTVEWPLVYERPEPVVFVGPTSGRGPDLRVTIERRYAPRLFFEVQGPTGPLAGAVEPTDLDAFVIASRGGAGTPGAPGTDGSPGTSGSPGSPGSCPGSPGGSGGAGGNGGNGTAGGPGGPGGPGGKVSVRVACVTGACGPVLGTVKKLVRSEGGAGGQGGEGGRGGSGGQGGPGGSGASCTDSQGHFTSVSGGSTGARGSDGSPGARGANGPNGPPGPVDIRGGD